MRKRLVDSYTDPATGIAYGLRGDPLDFGLAQQYTHEHVNGLTRDFLMKGSATPLVAGFNYTLAGGLSLSIANGQAFDAAGLGYETITDPPGQATVVALEAADVVNPRIDLVYILLEPNVPALPIPRTFRRLLSSAEILARQAPYLPENFTRYSEEHTKASIRVRKGTAAGVPVPPGTNANEAPLYEVRVNANAATLITGNITDRRNKVRSLHEAWAGIEALNNNPAIANFNESVDDRVNGLLAVTANTGLSKVYDDAGNLLTLSGVGATQAVMGMLAAADKTKIDNLDSTYVNVTGDQMTGTLGVVRSASVIDRSATQRGGDFQSQKLNGDSIGLVGAAYSLHGMSTGVEGYGRGSTGQPVHGVYGKAESESSSDGAQVHGVKGVASPSPTATSNGVYGVYGEAVGAGGSGTVNFGVFGKANGGATNWAGYYLGNVNITGSIAKGGGTFHIDHPLDPNNKDLVFGFTEAPEHLIILRVQKLMLSATLDAGVNLDTYFGLSGGTIEALCQDLRVESVYVPEGGDPVTVDFSGNFIDIVKPDASPRTVRITLMGARKDPFIMASPHVDGAGKLVPQQLKPVPTVEQLALLEDAEVALPEGDPRIGGSEMEVLPVLIGKQGFPRHAELYSAEHPQREITYVEEP